MQNKINRETFRTWIPFAVAITLLCGLIYVSVQQVLRQSANDPQIQIAEDTATALNQGADPNSVIPDSSVDMAKSLAPFIIIYDDSGVAVASTATLNGKTPMPPRGIFDYVKANGEDRLTWQPKPGVRIATVVTRYAGVRSGYVLAGRSMREVENRIDDEVKIITGAWLTSLTTGVAASFFFF